MSQYSIESHKTAQNHKNKLELLNAI